MEGCRHSLSLQVPLAGTKCYIQINEYLLSKAEIHDQFFCQFSWSVSFISLTDGSMHVYTISKKSSVFSLVMDSNTGHATAALVIATISK